MSRLSSSSAPEVRAELRLESLCNQLQLNSNSDSSASANSTRSTRTQTPSFSSSIPRSLSFFPTASSSSSSSSSSYRFSCDPRHLLSTEQRDFYETNGYLLIRKLIPLADIQAYATRFIEYATGARPVPVGMIAMRDVGLKGKPKKMGEESFTKLQDWLHDDVFYSYASHPAITKYVESIIGSSFRAMHSMLINKPADVGLGSSRHPPHQDLYYFPFRPAERIVATWTAMQSINRENGCLYIQPGSHHSPLLVHTYPNDGVVNAAYHGIHHLNHESAESQFQMIEMEAGDTLFFHPLLIHGSGRNNSKGFRKAISVHYASSSDCEYIDVEGTLQQGIAEEVRGFARKKGYDLHYLDYWRLKSRLVQSQVETDRLA